MADPHYDWEDLTPGFTFTTKSRHVSKEEIIEFASEYDPQPFHLDEEAAKDSILGGLCASGWHSCCIAMRLVADDFYPHCTPLGSPGIEETRWKRPLFAGESVSVTLEVTESRASKSRPALGLTRFLWTMKNKADDVIMTSDCWVMLARRPNEKKGAA